MILTTIKFDKIVVEFNRQKKTKVDIETSNQDI
jgi:hypothetical protein